MHSHTSQNQQESQQSKATANAPHQDDGASTLQLVDNRSEAKTQEKLHAIANESQQVSRQKVLQKMADQHVGVSEPSIQKKENQTGLPDKLKSGVERLSGYSMDDVKVHRNSSKPTQLQAHAYAQGNQIHLGPGQERHLPHEAWHVVQQKQGRVKPTKQLKAQGTAVNDNPGLEREADVMGRKAMEGAGAFTSNRSEGDNSISKEKKPMKVFQLAKWQLFKFNNTPISWSEVLDDGTHGDELISHKDAKIKWKKNIPQDWEFENHDVFDEDKDPHLRRGQPPPDIGDFPTGGGFLGMGGMSRRPFSQPRPQPSGGTSSGPKDQSGPLPIIPDRGVRFTSPEEVTDDNPHPPVPRAVPPSYIPGTDLGIVRQLGDTCALFAVLNAEAATSPHCYRVSTISNVLQLIPDAIIKKKFQRGGGLKPRDLGFSLSSEFDNDSSGAKVAVSGGRATRDSRVRRQAISHAYALSSGPDGPKLINSTGFKRKAVQDIKPEELNLDFTIYELPPPSDEELLFEGTYLSVDGTRAMNNYLMSITRGVSSENIMTKFLTKSHLLGPTVELLKQIRELEIIARIDASQAHEINSLLNRIRDSASKLG